MADHQLDGAECLVTPETPGETPGVTPPVVSGEADAAPPAVSGKTAAQRFPDRTFCWYTRAIGPFSTAEQCATEYDRAYAAGKEYTPPAGVEWYEYGRWRGSGRMRMGWRRRRANWFTPARMARTVSPAARGTWIRRPRTPSACAGRRWQSTSRAHGTHSPPTGS